MDFGEVRILQLLSRAGKGPRLLLGVLGQVGHGKDRWTEKQRATLRHLARRGFVKIDSTVMYGDMAGRYNLYELTAEGRLALQRDRAQNKR